MTERRTRTDEELYDDGVVNSADEFDGLEMVEAMNELAEIVGETIPGNLRIIDGEIRAEIAHMHSRSQSETSGIS